VKYIKELSKDLTPEEKNLRMNRGGRKHRRKDLQQKSSSIRTLSIKMGRYLDELRKVQKEHEIFADAVDELLSNVGKILKLPTVEKEFNIEESKEECPTCHKRFKQLAKHKCKVKEEHANKDETDMS